MVRGTCVGVVVAASLVVQLAAQIPFVPEAVDRSASALPRLHSLIVSRNGQVVFERYYRSARADRPVNVKSVSKSIISALVGIAVDRALIDLRTPIANYFPDLGRAELVEKRAITVEDLLTMRSGLESTSGRNYGAWVLSRNWVQHVLTRPMFAEPGAIMEYSTGNTHLLSAILTKATGKSTWQLANEVLAAPLGFRFPEWPRDPQGIYFGGNEMLMTPQQMLAFGQLYLSGGTAGGRQIVSRRWVERSCQGRAREFLPGERRGERPREDPYSLGDLLRDRKYGYGWWVDDLAGQEACFAWGYGGQYLFLLPTLDMVIVTTASPDVSEERRDYRRRLIDMLSRLVIAPFAGPRS